MNDQAELSTTPATPLAPTVKLAKLSQRHKEVLALVAQGLGRTEIGALVGYEPEYISWLVRQDVCRAYLSDMTAIVDFRLEAMTSESVDTISEVMKCGTGEDRLKAAKLQLEAVGRVGAGRSGPLPPSNTPDHLQHLAERLVGLLRNTRGGPGGPSDVVDVESRPA